MPELFPDVLTLLTCMLIVACAHLVYATVGFGAGMLAVSLMAIVLPDLAGAVVALLIINFISEIVVLRYVWRHARIVLVLGLLPGISVGLWLGANLLASGDAGSLKRLLGVVVSATGACLLCSGSLQFRGLKAVSESASNLVADSGYRDRWSWTVLAGLASGALCGIFGIGGPPVVVCLRAYRLDKATFRATLLGLFLIMSVLRFSVYTCRGMISAAHFSAAAWLLPASMLGMLAGMRLHNHLSERRFSGAVAVILIVLGVLLLAGSAR